MAGKTLRQRSKKIFHHQSKSVNAAAVILVLASIVSAVLGIFRDRLLAGRFGAGDELDIYYTAFRIPDFLTMVLVMGAIGAAVIPVFGEYLVRSKKESFKFISNLLNLFLVSLVFIALFLFLIAPLLISLIAPGFEGEKREAAIVFTRIMLLSPLILGISNIISAILRVFRRFLLTSVSPILYNLGIIIGIIFFIPRLGLIGLPLGVVFGSFLHLLIQIPVLFQIGFRVQKIFDFGDPGFKKVVKLTIPRSIGLAASQINLIVMTALASNLTSGKIAIFSLADGLSRPVLTFVGISFATAAFPSLAMSFSKKNKEKFSKIFSETFSKIIFLILPLSFFLFIFREPLVKIIFGSGKFGFPENLLTSACLGMFALGLFAQCLSVLLVRAFYAMRNTVIPAATSVAAMVANIGFAFLFVWLLSFPNQFHEFVSGFLGIQGVDNIKIVGLPLAFSVSAVFQFLLLSLFFQKKIKGFISVAGIYRAKGQSGS